MNRITSVSLLLGMSVLIGYNLGAHGGILHKLSNRVLRLFGFSGDDRDDNGANAKRAMHNGTGEQHKKRAQQFGGNSDNNNNVHFMNGRTKPSEELVIEEIDEMSDFTCDSAIDVQYGSTLPDDDLDEQLMELLSYNDLYSDFYGKNDSQDPLIQEPREDGDESPRKRFRTRTVDRIDQVLHQIDDIKKSIVEIDDELYHIAGSTYANFNPSFLTLTNTFVDEFLKDDEIFDSTSDRKTSEDRSSLSGTKVYSDEASDSRKNGSQDPGKAKERHSATRDTRHNSKQSSFSDLDSLQLEWDFDFESSYDYYSGVDTKDASSAESGDSDKKQSPLKEKLSSAANGLDMPMTDEQKLKNMHDLLDEAKKLGLLNNIIDALAPSHESTRKEAELNEEEEAVQYPHRKRNKS